MSVRYICDRCGKEIPENERFNVKVCKKNSSIYYHPQDWGSKDLCQDCTEKIIETTFEPENGQNVKLNLPEHLTNMDKLQNMSKEELAICLSHGRCAFCGMDAEECDMACEAECEPEIYSWLEQIAEEDDVKRKKPTNLDRIREMPAGDLAKMLQNCICEYCAYRTLKDCDVNCTKGICTWLNQEVSE